MELFKLFGTIAIDNEGANNALQETIGNGESSEKRLTDAFKKIGAAVATYFTVQKIIDFGKQLVSLASDAETAAAKVETLLSSGTDTTAYFNDMLNASTDAGVAMTEYAEAVYSAISASVDQADAVDFTSNAIKLAKAGFTEASTAVDVLTTAINAYGLSADDATHISDVLINTQNLGKTTVDELASSIGMVIPLASAYGVNIENLSSAYAEMTKGGIATAQATTYLKGMMTELADPSKAVAKIIQTETGQSFADLMASGSSLGDVLEILMTSVDGDATAFSNLWSSTEAGTGALALANAGAEAFNDTLGSMYDSAGTTQAAYDTVTNTFSEKTKKMKVAAQNFGTEIGQKLLPTLSNLVDKITVVIESLEGQLEPAFDKVKEIVAQAKEKFDQFSDWCSQHQGTIETIAIIVGSFAAAWVLVNGAIAIWTAIGVAATAVTTAFGAAVAFLTSPVTLVIIAIAALIAIVVLLVKNWDKIKAKAIEIGTAVAEAWEEMKAKISEKVASIVANVTSKFNDIKAKASSIFNSVKSTVSSIWSGIQNSISNAVNVAKNAVSNTFENIKTTIKEKLDNALDTVKGIVKKIKDAFKFTWTLPKFKLPHVSVSGGEPPYGIGGQGSLPSFSVKWYKKGGILTEPTIFGMNSSGFLGGGEAGAEAVAPIDTLKGYVSEAVASQNAGLIAALDRILDAIETMDENMGGNLRKAMDGTSLSINNREFGRLVRGVI